MKKFNLIIKIALPLMASFLAQKGMQLIDTIMMGHLGPQALAAGAFGTSIFMTLVVFCMGTLTSVGVCIARSNGANQQAEIKSNLQHGMLLALALSFPCIIIIWYAPYLLEYMDIESIIVKNTSLLLHSLVWGVPGFLLFFVYREFVAVFALANIVTLVALCAIPLTYFVNTIFIYGKYGFPAFGISGIGYAGAGVMWFMFLCMFLYSKQQDILKAHTVSFRWFKIEFRKIFSMLLLGIPSGLLYILDMGMFLFAAIMMGYFGEDALAAHQIAVQCTALTFSVPFALSTATALQVSHAVGKNNLLQAKHFIYMALGIGLVISILIAFIFIFIPQTISCLFLEESVLYQDEIIQLTASFLVLAALFQCFDALQAILNGALIGLQDTLVPTLLCTFCYFFIGIGSAYYLSFYTHFATLGIWYGLALGICSAALVIALRFLWWHLGEPIQKPPKCLAIHERPPTALCNP